MNFKSNKLSWILPTIFVGIACFLYSIMKSKNLSISENLSNLGAILDPIVGLVSVMLFFKALKDQAAQTREQGKQIEELRQQTEESKKQTEIMAKQFEDQKLKNKIDLDLANYAGIRDTIIFLERTITEKFNGHKFNIFEFKIRETISGFNDLICKEYKEYMQCLLKNNDENVKKLVEDFRSLNDIVLDFIERFVELIKQQDEFQQYKLIGEDEKNKVPIDYIIDNYNKIREILPPLLRIYIDEVNDLSKLFRDYRIIVVNVIQHTIWLKEYPDPESYEEDYELALKWVKELKAKNRCPKICEEYFKKDLEINLPAA